MKLLKSLGKYMLRGVYYSIAFGGIGAVFAFIKKWPLLKGSYVFIIGGGVFAMAVSVLMLIGTPETRKRMLLDKEEYENPKRGGEGLGPALMSMVMVAIGLFLEALLHG
ncbi:MAG: hypothetical protein ACOYVK_05840 [Bacillota bacterium]